jgi:hypothetical protein
MNPYPTIPTFRVFLAIGFGGITEVFVDVFENRAPD